MTDANHPVYKDDTQSQLKTKADGTDSGVREKLYNGEASRHHATNSWTSSQATSLKANPPTRSSLNYFLYLSEKVNRHLDWVDKVSQLAKITMSALTKFPLPPQQQCHKYKYPHTPTVSQTGETSMEMVTKMSLVYRNKLYKGNFKFMAAAISKFESNDVCKMI